MKHLLFAGLLALALPRAAAADYHVISPDEIDLGEVEMETNGAATLDTRPDHSHAASYTAELGTGLTPWWHSEVELGFARDPGPSQPALADAVVWENMVQLTPQGEYWADLGAYAEYGQSLTSGAHAGSNQITFGPVAAKDIGRTTETVNLLGTRQFGPDETTQGLDVSYAVQSRWNLSAAFSPAVELYGDAGVVGTSPRLSQQPILLGPVAVGVIPLSRLGLGQAGQFKYELGYLFGATPGSDRGTLRWRMELEIPF